MDSSDSSIPKCGFCGKTQAEVNRLLSGKSAFICETCVKACQTILSQPEPQAAQNSPRIPPSISLEDYWWQRGLPPIPSILGENDLSAAQTSEFHRALEIVSMFQKHPNGHWGERSANSRAQHRWPDAKIIIEDIEAIRRTWFQFGWPGLVAMIKEGRSDRLGMNRISYHSARHEVKCMTAVEITSQPKQPVFIDTACTTMLKCHTDLVAKIYAVGLESQFGRYQFRMVYYKPPNYPEASNFACVYTRIS